jgi:hypothetical protein
VSVRSGLGYQRYTQLIADIQRVANEVVGSTNKEADYKKGTLCVASLDGTATGVWMTARHY